MRKLAIIGCGNMGSAIAEGIIRANYMLPENIILNRRNADALEGFSKMGCKVVSDSVEAAGMADVVMLAVKPQMLPDVMANIADSCIGKLVISIAAGTTIDSIKSVLTKSPVVRVMPNTPLMVGEGVSAICSSSDTTEADLDFSAGLFRSAGSVVFIGEDQMNSVTAVTSSSIALFSRFIGDICEWAKANGFAEMPESELCAMVSAAAAGTAKILREKDMKPAELVRAVASPKGTTEAALKSLDENGFDKIVSDSLDACLKRAEELSKG